MRKKRLVSPASAAELIVTYHDGIIEDWLHNALDCLCCGDGLNERDRMILQRVLQRLAVQQAVSAEEAKRKK